MTILNLEVDPQSTSSTQSQPTASSTYGNNNQQNVAANPSLILAFLALSFFTMAMIFIFGFRRYHYYSERWFSRPGAGRARGPYLNWHTERSAEVMRLKRLPSAEPKLYDACVDANGWWEEVKATGVLGGGDESDASWSWHAIMPLSASKVANTDHSRVIAPCPRTRVRSASNSPSNAVFRRFWRLGAAHRLSLPSSPNPKAMAAAAAAAAASSLSTLRVAVLVAMPSESHPIYYRDLQGEKTRCRRSIDGYDLGFYEVPWDDSDNT